LSVTGSSPVWSAQVSQPSPTLRSTTTSGLSTKLLPPFQVKRAAANRSMTAGGCVIGPAFPPSSGSDAS
jgi:hypothetical protein